MIFVIGISALLACIGWVAANDVLALEQAGKDGHHHHPGGGQLRRRGTMLEGERPDRIQSLFKLFAAFTGGRDKIVAGPYTLNSDMDYRA